MSDNNSNSKKKTYTTLLKKAGYQHISVGSVLTKDNISELPSIQKFCIENDFTFRVTAFQFEGFSRNDNSLRKLYRIPDFLEKIKNTVRISSKYPINNTRTYLKSIIDYYSQNKYHPLNCMVGYYSIFILPDGSLSLCNLMRKDAIIENIKNHSLNELWHGDDAVAVRKMIKEKQCPSCWLSCFAEDNIRFSVKYFPGNFKYFFSKAIEYFYKR